MVSFFPGCSLNPVRSVVSPDPHLSSYSLSLPQEVLWPECQKGAKKKKKWSKCQWPSLGVRLPLQIHTSSAEEKSHLACSALKALSVYTVARATSPGN